MLEKINLNHLRIFEVVYRTKSMTAAAAALYMTQSGVSQHIKMLEDILEIHLFDRVKNRLVPTSLGRELYAYCVQGLTILENGLKEVKEEKDQFCGVIKLGVPIEFGNNVIIPKLADFSKKHPKISYHLRYGELTRISTLLLQGELDFAVIDDIPVDTSINVKKFYKEEIFLCCHKIYLKSKGHIGMDLPSLEKLDFIDFSVDLPLTKTWFIHHFGSVSPRLQVKAILDDIQGMGRMIVRGLGVGILPDHLVKKYQKADIPLHIFEGPKGKIINHLGLASISGKEHSLAVNSLMQEILGPKSESDFL